MSCRADRAIPTTANAPATTFAARTWERAGLNRAVGRIVPKRHSLVTRESGHPD